MILYHGSYTVIKTPDLSFSRRRTDFGRGFYLTPLREQAVRWAERFLRERGTAVLSLYAFLPKPGDGLPPEKKILEFGAYDLAWLNFITDCRLGRPVDTEWDLVIGGVANDKVFDTLQLYFDRLIGAEEAIGRLRYGKPNLQYCFKSQALIDDYLRFADSEALQ
ncbi:MAG: DUF3990 domain-containing protein [Clostridiales Family XIII bacterium]|jgi:hypothetical protein|nr:DUF3990 domain-containing protein [Clostridiales Family XIII bacterium]